MMSSMVSSQQPQTDIGTNALLIRTQPICDRAKQVAAEDRESPSYQLS